MVGLTDELHFAKAINVETLKDDPKGVLMTPSHVHKALQAYLGVDLYAYEKGFGLSDIENLPLFDPYVAS